MFMLLLRRAVRLLGNCGLSAHLTGTLLHHCGQLDSHHISHSISLREFLLLEYSASLMSHHSLWRVGCRLPPAVSSGMEGHILKSTLSTFHLRRIRRL
ncbi:Nucleoporin nup85 [Desmophyllum pertusum]|uniref:Nuclear pore complex protein Nup85 n=1 Tax=Desmophyllum pertusum TaxID=174260 RepID=A0A9X0CN39_9CNID|nr:Nucleoporin nup85 [Desmophyllum pertusum]